MGGRELKEANKMTVTEKINHPTTLATIARIRDIEIKKLLDLNPHIKSENESINNIDIFLPRIHQTAYIRRNTDKEDNEDKNEDKKKKQHVVTSNILTPLLNKIRPKLIEVISKITAFNRTSVSLYRKCHHNDKQIYIHYNLWFAEGHNEEMDLFVRSPDDVYRKYQKEIYDEYEKALYTMGMFFRNMIYLYHFIDNRDFFEEKVNEKIKDALDFTNKFLNVVLGRINKYLFYILHLYQMLNGSCEDWVIYKNITLLCNMTFKKFASHFSDKGDIEHFIPYFGGRVDDLFCFRRKTIANFARIKYGVDGEIINDTYIFNYSLDYSDKKTTRKINELRDGLDKGLDDISGELSDNYDEEIIKAHTMYMGRFFYNIGSDIKKVIDELETFLTKHPKAKVIGKWNEVMSLYSKLKTEIRRTKDLFMETGEYDEDIQDCVNRIRILYSCFSVAVGLYQIAGLVDHEIDWFETLFVDEESFYEDIKASLEELLEISEETDVIKAGMKWEELLTKIEKYSTCAEKLIQDGNFWGGLVREIIIIIIVIALTIVTGAVFTGIFSGFGFSLAFVKGATFATEVIIFCLAHEALSAFMEERSFFNGSFVQFGFSLASTAIMFGVFRGVGKMIRGLVDIGLLSSKLSVFFATWFATFFTSTLITAPFFAASLLANGQDLFSGREWGKFLMTQAILSGVLSATTLLSNQIAKIQKKISSSTAKLGFKAKKYIGKLSIEVRRNKIIQQGKELLQIKEGLEKKYRVVFERNEETFNKFVREYMKAIDKGKVLLKLLKQMRIDLLTLEQTLVKKYGGTDIGPNGELFAMEQFLKQAEVWIKSIEYIPDYKYTTAIIVHEQIPNNRIDGLTPPIGKGKEYYLGRILKIIEHAPEIKKQLIEGNPLKIIREELPRGMENAHKGRTDIQYMIERGRLKDVIKITVFDGDGQGDVPGNVIDEPYTALDYKGQEEGMKNTDYEIMEVDIDDAVDLDVAKTISKDLLSLHREAILDGAISKPEIPIGTGKMGGGNYKPNVITFALYLETGECAFGYPGQTSTQEAKKTFRLSDWNPSYSEHIDPMLMKWIQNTKREALKQTGKESFEQYWSVENCAEVWTVNKLLKKLRLKGIKDIKPEKILIRSIEFRSGDHKDPCDNCKCTFKNCNIHD